jgi:putative transposase
MKKSQFNEEQILKILEEAKAGKKLSDLCREYRISNYTFYTWRKKFSGLEVSEAKRLRELEQENARLRRVVADQVLDITVLKDALGKK